jgi:hypothetical protein
VSRASTGLSKAEKRRARLQEAHPHPYALYRTGRLAELFDVDPSTIWKWRKTGVLPPFKEIAGVRGLTGKQLAKLLGDDDD